MDPPLSLPPDLEAFKRLIATRGKSKGGPAQNFVKKVDILSVELLVDRTCRLALHLIECGLIKQFTGLYPSPKTIDG